MLKFKHLTAVFISIAGLAFVSPVFANSGWTKVSMSEDKNAFYVDLASIKGNERIRHYKDLITFEKSINFKSTLQGYSITSDNSVDCQNYSYRTYKSFWFDKNGDELKVNPEPEVKKYRLEATYKPVLDLVCSQAKIGLSQPLVMGKNYSKVLSDNLPSCYMETSDNRILNLTGICTSSSNSLSYSGRVTGGNETPSRFGSWYCVGDCKGSSGSSVSGASSSGSFSVPGASSFDSSAPCNTSTDFASDKSRCGDRAADKKPGGV